MESPILRLMEYAVRWLSYYGGKKDKIAHLIGLICEFNPNAFFTTDDVRSASEGIFPSDPINFPLSYF